MSAQFIYYVYAYLRKNGTPYYIGKGKRNRANSKHKRINGSDFLPRDPSRIVFLETNLSEIGALAIERRMIRWYGRKDNGTGILINLTDGGDGAGGVVVSRETRKKLSEAHKGKKMSESMKKKMRELNKGKILSKETRRKMSEYRKGKNKEHKSEETRISHSKKVSESKKGRRWWTDGRIDKMSRECPGENFYLGRSNLPKQNPDDN